MLPVGVGQKTDDSPGMAQQGKPGRRPSIPEADRLAICARTKKWREDAKLSQGKIAEQLNKWVEREITADTYRQWEETSLLPHDLIIPFCYITGADPFRLLSGEPYRVANVVPFPTGKRKAN